MQRGERVQEEAWAEEWAGVGAGVGARVGVPAVLRTLREDLWTTAYDPLPRMRGPRLLCRLPHVLIAVVAVVMMFAYSNNLAHGFGIGADQAFLLSAVQSGALVVALFRPVPAWWAVMIVMFLSSRSGHPDLAEPPFFPWAGIGVVVQAGVLLLLALRVRPRAAAEALVITLLVGLSSITLITHGRTADIGPALGILAVVVLVGSALRGRRVANSQLVVQAGITAEERARRTLLEERSRIARELHDVVAHHMSVISIQAQVAPHLVENPPPELLENLAGIRENALDALTELRRVLGVLRSEDPAAEGVRHAPQPTLDRLTELVGKVRAAGLTVETETVGAPRPLSPGVELSAFRIVQEALSNAMRHAPGAAVRVVVAYQADSLMVRVSNTRPASSGATPSAGAGHGLLGMRERTTMLGGELAAGPTPNGGFEVTATMPESMPEAASLPVPAPVPAPVPVPVPVPAPAPESASLAERVPFTESAGGPE